jgi:hypothetical protein
MRTTKPLTVALFLAGAAVLAVVSSVQAQAEVLIDPSFCVVIDAQGDIVPAPDGAVVITNNPQSNCKATCRATVPNPTGEQIVWDFGNTGVPCVLGGCGSTTSWREVISPSGQATLQCHFNPGNP